MFLTYPWFCDWRGISRYRLWMTRQQSLSAGTFRGTRHPPVKHPWIILVFLFLFIRYSQVRYIKERSMTWFTSTASKKFRNTKIWYQWTTTVPEKKQSNKKSNFSYFSFISSSRVVIITFNISWASCSSLQNKTNKNNDFSCNLQQMRENVMKMKN